MFLIAEVGVNHNGRIENCYRLIDAAKEANADAVKFQLFESQKLWGDDRIKHLEIRYDDMAEFADYCKEIGIEFMCSPFGLAELLWLKPLLKRIKIPSGLMTSKKLLDAADETRLPVLLSTGMHTFDEVEESLGRLTNDVTLLQCTSSYPCRLEDVNLSAMTSLRDINDKVGLSDHTTSITVPIAAAALGACAIEKHFTLDRTQEGPDHKASITPKEFKAMRLAIIEVLAALGDGEKRVLPCEEALRKQWRKQ